MFFYEVHKWKADQLVSLRKSVGSQLELYLCNVVFIFFLLPPLPLSPCLPIELFQFCNSLLINSTNTGNVLYISVKKHIYISPPFLKKMFYRGKMLTI